VLHFGKVDDQINEHSCHDKGVPLCYCHYTEEVPDPQGAPAIMEQCSDLSLWNDQITMINECNCAIGFSNCCLLKDDLSYSTSHRFKDQMGFEEFNAKLQKLNKKQWESNEPFPACHPSMYDRRFGSLMDVFKKCDNSSPEGSAAYYCNNCIKTKSKHPTIICFKCMDHLEEIKKVKTREETTTKTLDFLKR